MLSFIAYIASDPQLTVSRRRSMLPRPFSPLPQPASSLESLIPRTKEGPARYARYHLTPSESALPRNRCVTRLESALPKSLHLKPFRIRTYEKWRGGGGQRLTRNMVRRPPFPPVRGAVSALDFPTHRKQGWFLGWPRRDLLQFRILCAQRLRHVHLRPAQHADQLQCV